MAISQKKLEDILEKADLSGGRPRSFSGGLYNESYLIEHQNEHYVLRIAPPDDVSKLFYEKQMMRAEPGLHRLVRRHTDLPVPEILFYDFSGEVINRDYLVMEFLEGRSGSFDHEELGYYTRQLHEIPGDYCGYPDRPAPVESSWPGVFQQYVRLIFEDCRSCGIIDKEEEAWFLSVYSGYEDLIPEAGPRLLHLDLWSQNILTKNGSISAILDFDRGLYGDRELEFAVLDTYGYSTPDFFRGYGDPRPEHREALIRQRLYIVYEIIKYAFISHARKGSRSSGRQTVEECRQLLEPLAREL